MVFMPNKSTPDYLFEKANQCFRRSRTDSNARVELEALGNEFMVKAVELDIKLQKLAKATTPTRSNLINFDAYADLSVPFVDIGDSHAVGQGS
jgi:hypothetical protein